MDSPTYPAPTTVIFIALSKLHETNARRIARHSRKALYPAQRIESMPNSARRAPSLLLAREALFVERSKRQPHALKY